MAKDKKSKSAKKSGRIAIVVSQFNETVTEGLLGGALTSLYQNGYEGKDIDVIRCPGAFEIPLTAKALCRSGKYCGIVCLGAVIKGETAHFEFISYAVTTGILQLNMEFNIPVSFGVLTAYNPEQAKARSAKDARNKGGEAADACIEMIALLKSI